MRGDFFTPARMPHRRSRAGRTHGQASARRPSYGRRVGRRCFHRPHQRTVGAEARQYRQPFAESSGQRPSIRGHPLRTSVFNRGAARCRARSGRTRPSTPARRGRPPRHPDTSDTDAKSYRARSPRARSCRWVVRRAPPSRRARAAPPRHRPEALVTPAADERADVVCEHRTDGNAAVTVQPPRHLDGHDVPCAAGLRAWPSAGGSSRDGPASRRTHRSSARGSAAA